MALHACLFVLRTCIIHCNVFHISMPTAKALLPKVALMFWSHVNTLHQAEHRVNPSPLCDSNRWGVFALEMLLVIPSLVSEEVLKFIFHIAKPA